MWMNEWENKCTLNLAETCVDSLILKDLFTLTGYNENYLSALLPVRMNYGDIMGSHRLRQAICKLYTEQNIENVVTTHGTIGANMLVHKTLVERGDKVVSIVPTYQQHYSIPESIGADVRLLKLHEEQGWLPDLNKLRDMTKDGVKLIALTNPNNPTGALISEQMLRDIAEIASTAGAWILCDEVYRGSNQTGSGMSVAMADIYKKGISTSGMSKVFSLAGLRLGWIAGPKYFIKDVMTHRDYDTISIGMINDHLATLALENYNPILERTKRITRDNLAVLESWICNEPKLSWVKPMSGTTALIKYERSINSYEFCRELLEKTGVMLTPGSAMGMEGYVRIGYANAPKILIDGLERISNYLDTFSVKTY